MASVPDVARGLVTKNLGTKLAAALLALSVWWFIGAELTREDTLHVPYVIQVGEEASGDWKIVGPGTAVVKITLRGPRQTLDALRQRPTAAIRDDLKGKYILDRPVLAGLGRAEGAITIDVAPPHFEPLPYNGLEIVSVDPKTMTVSVSRLTSREVTLAPPRVSGRPRKGFQVAREAVSVSPARVTLHGPMAAIQKLTEPVETEPLDVTEAGRQVVAAVRLPAALRDSGVSLAGNEQPIAVVEVVPELKRRKLRVAVRERWPDGLARRPEWQVKIATELEIEVEGPADVVDQLTKDDLVAIACVPDNFRLEPDRETTQGEAQLLYAHPADAQGRLAGVKVVDPRSDIPFEVREPRG